MSNLDTFMTEYEKQLRAAHAANPGAYAYPADNIPALVGSVRGAIARQGASVLPTGPTVKATCKALGIKSTQKAINEYIGHMSGKQIAKLADTIANDAFRAHGDSVTFDIFDVGKVLDAGRNAFVNSIAMGEDLDTARSYADTAVKEAVQTYRKDGAS